jgi:hypothetical protein
MARSDTALCAGWAAWHGAFPGKTATQRSHLGGVPPAIMMFINLRAVCPDLTRTERRNNLIEFDVLKRNTSVDAKEKPLN